MTAAGDALERWEADAADDGVVHLDIPAHARRDRTFEVSVSAVVRTGAGAPWHELRVLLNGSQQWSRREQPAADSADSLDYRVRRTVPLGEPLRITAVTAGERVVRQSLRISAEEE